MLPVTVLLPVDFTVALALGAPCIYNPKSLPVTMLLLIVTEAVPEGCASELTPKKLFEIVERITLIRLFAEAVSENAKMPLKPPVTNVSRTVAVVVDVAPFAKMPMALPRNLDFEMVAVAPP